MKRMIASLARNWFSCPRDRRSTRLLFASTARAGRWNHRFLVPPNETRSDSELGRFASNTSPQIARASHKVTQQEGREGDEMLVLVDDRLTKLDAEALAKVNSLLGQQLSQLERLVTKDIDWNQWPSEPPLVVPCEQLDVLQLKVNEMLARLSRPNQRWSAMLPVAGLALATILLVSLGLVVLAQRQGGRIAGGLRQSAGSVVLSPIEAKRFKDLAELVGFPIANPLTDATCEDLAAHLEDQLFGGPFPDRTRVPNQQLKAPSLEQRERDTQQVANNLKSNTHGRDRLSNVLKHVGKTVGKASFEDWMDTGLDDEQLGRLFPAPERSFAPQGLLGSKELALAPVLTPQMTLRRLWPLIERLRALYKTVRPLELPKEPDKYDEFFGQVRSLNLELSPAAHATKQNAPQRRFFVPEDLNALRQLHELLGYPSTVELYHPSQNEPPFDLLSRLRAVGEAADNTDTLLNDRDLKKEASKNRRNAKQKAFEALIELVASCREVSESLHHTTTPVTQ